MKKRIWAFSIPAVILLAVFLVPSLLTSQSAVMDKPSKEDVAHKMQSIQMPFVANNGQVDAQVKYYANTFGGTVFVTKDGEIVYSLPNNSSDVETQCLASSMHSPNGISPLERGTHPLIPSREGNGVCNTTPISHDRNETHPRPLPYRSMGQALLEGRSGVALKEQFVGAKTRTVQGEEKSVTKVNYFKGNDSSKWKTNISTYDVVNLGEIYKGIELRLKAYGNNVEKLFCVKPDANPDQIKIKLSGIQPSENPPPLSPSARGTGSCPPLAGAGGGLGARGLWVNEHGELVAETELGAVKFTKPVAYQEINGKRVDVECKYTIADCGMQNAECKTNLKSEFQYPNSENPKSSIQNFEAEVSNPKSKIANHKLEYGFKVASYDKTKDLIIDPLLASTYLGGSNEDTVYSLALDTNGNVYVTGSTYSSDFPITSGAYNTSYTGGDVFVSKLDSGLTSLLASMFLGGSGYEECFSLTLDTNGNVYVTGWTKSSDFTITSGAYDTSYNGGNTYGGDVFVSKLDGGLTSLLASTYLGGAANDYGYSLTLDTNGNVYVTGWTSSIDFPTTRGAYDTSYTGGDVFISKLDGGLTSLLASTYLGGSSQEFGQSLTLDTSGNVYVTGYTSSTNFPTTSGAYDTSLDGYGSYSDVFVSKLDGGLTNLLASTYLGGFYEDKGYSIAIDTSGNVYVTGYTTNGNYFPVTSGVYDTHYNGGNSDAFISKLDNNLSSSKPTVTTGSVSNTTASSAILSGTVNANGLSTTAWFNYGITSGIYTGTSTTQSVSGSSDTTVSIGISGLSSNRTYYYRIAASNSAGISYGSEASFATKTASATPTPTTSPAPTLPPVPTPLVSPTTKPTITPVASPSPEPTLPPLPTPKVSPSPVQEGIVFGIVNDESDNPLKDVTVTITGNNVSSNTTTDDDGYYEFTGLAAGSYTLTYEMEGYKAQSQEISLDAGETKELEVVTMEEVVMGTIYGYVVNIQGNPIEDARVRLKGVRTKVSKSTASDADGFFEFTDLGADTYLLFAKKTRFKKTKVTVRLKEGEDKEVEIEMKKTSKRIIKASVR